MKLIVGKLGILVGLRVKVVIVGNFVILVVDLRVK